MKFGRIVADDISTAILAGCPIIHTHEDVTPAQACAKRTTAHAIAVAAKEEPSLSNRCSLGIREIAGVCSVGIVEQVVCSGAFETDSDLTVRVALQIPVALANRQRALGITVVDYLIPRVRCGPHNTDFKRVTRRPIIHNFGLAGEPEAALLEPVCSDVDIALGAVIPEEHGLVHPARNSQRNLAVALASRRRFKLGNTLLKIRAAIAAQIRRFGRCKATSDQPESRR